MDEVRARMRNEDAIMKQISDEVSTHAFPACQVGFGAAGFEKKMETLVHPMRLEHFTHASLAIFFKEILTNMNDYGTENRSTVCCLFVFQSYAHTSRPRAQLTLRVSQGI
jgi:two-component sensor histidine kinase